MSVFEIVVLGWMSAMSASLITLIALTASLRTSDRNRGNLCTERGEKIEHIYGQLKEINEKVTTVCTKVDILLDNGRKKEG